MKQQKIYFKTYFYHVFLGISIGMTSGVILGGTLNPILSFKAYDQKIISDSISILSRKQYMDLPSGK
ncbi:MAG: hypothetical protein ACK4GL_10985 [Flavobacteriales bacterium]